MKWAVLLLLAFSLAAGCMMAGCDTPTQPADQLQVVAFTAPWCKVCEQQKPTVQLMESEGFAVTYIDIDADPVTAKQYGVTSVPTYIVYGESKELKRLDNALLALKLLRGLREFLR